MGVPFTNLFDAQDITLTALKNKKIAIDAYNFLYQFLASIRTQDGTLLTNKKGEVTSHIVGLLSRTTRLLEHQIKPVYVFDGVAPALKKEERLRRSALKDQAKEQYEQASQMQDTAAMKKFAARTLSLTPLMVEQAKTLLTYMGVPWLDAPSEGEAQISHMTKLGIVDYAASQDYDSLLFGTKKLVRNLNITGKKKYKLTYQTIGPQLLNLDTILSQLAITHDQLIYMGLLVGTDFNYGGIHGIGPKKALKLVKEIVDPQELFVRVNWDEHCKTPWQDIYDIFKTLPVKDDCTLVWKKPQEKLKEFLIDTCDFNEERVNETVLKLEKTVNEQTGLGQYFT